MSIQKEIDALAAETLAIQAILIGFASRLAAQSPELHKAIGWGFDDAANYVEHIAIKLGTAAKPGQTVKAIQIVESLRAASLGKPSQPKHVV